MSNKKFELEFKNKVIRLHLEEGRTLASLSDEYNVNKTTVCNWVKQYREECQHNPVKQEEKDYFQENLRLRKELEELKKENLFLKKAAAFFAKEID
jgi:transposase